MALLHSSFPKHDFHTHIGQYWNVYYDYHDVFRTLKANGIESTTCAYLTPLFEDKNAALDFYQAVVTEWRKAITFSSSIALNVKPLWWADPLVLQSGLTVENIFSDFTFEGIALHPRLHDWTKSDNEQLTTYLFVFAEKHNVPIFIHTGVNIEDSPYLFEPWFKNFPKVKAHLAHCKDSASITDLFSKYPNLLGDTAFCPNDSYKAICKAGFSERMLFGTDFPITHYVELGETERQGNVFQPRIEELCKNYEQAISENALISSLETKD